MKIRVVFALCVAAGLTLAGCSGDVSPPADTRSNATLSADEAAQYLLAEAPGEAVEVMAARESAGDGDEVIVVGRIGGSKSPWIDGRAAFPIVDRSVKACNEISGDRCPTPWDYCCQLDLLARGTALVKLVDADGRALAFDARAIPGVTELAAVVVKGTAHRDEAGNLTITANRIYIQETP